MARGQLKPRKKKPLIVICSEGQKKSSEYYYFQNYKTRDLRIQFSEGKNTDPKGMLNDLLKYMQREDIKSEDDVRIFLVLDTDLNVERINEIKKIEKKCLSNNIEIITSAPTFEIWYLLHFRQNKLKFGSSLEVKKEIEKILKQPYFATMNIYKIIKESTNKAREIAKSIEEKAIKNKEDLIKVNPHTSIYKIIDTIDDFNEL